MDVDRGVTEKSPHTYLLKALNEREATGGPVAKQAEPSIEHPRCLEANGSLGLSWV